MTTSVEAVTSIRAPSRRKRVTRNPKRRRGYEPEEDEIYPINGPGGDPKSDK